MIVLTEEDLQELRERVLQQKMNELFEEPSTYEDDDNDANGMARVFWIDRKGTLFFSCIYVWTYYWVHSWI